MQTTTIVVLLSVVMWTGHYLGPTACKHNEKVLPGGIRGSCCVFVSLTILTDALHLTIWATCTVNCFCTSILSELKNKTEQRIKAESRREKKINAINSNLNNEKHEVQAWQSIKNVSVAGMFLNWSNLQWIGPKYSRMCHLSQWFSHRLT